MANEVTTSADVIDPEVWADALAPLILGKAVMLQNGITTTDDQLVGEPGSTVNFPKWDYLGDAEDLTEGVAIESDKLTITHSPATIKEVGKAVDITDTARLIALNDPNAEVTRQIPLTISRKIDTDLRAAAKYTHTNGGGGDPIPTTSPLIVPSFANALSWAAYVDAIKLFGDEYTPDEIGAVIVHTNQYNQLLKDANFITVDKLGASATILRGQVGQIGAAPVLLSDREPVITDIDSGTGGNQPGHNVLIIKKGALALKYKRRPLVETQRQAKKRLTEIVATTHYAVKRVDDRGVIVLGVKD